MSSIHQEEKLATWLNDHPEVTTAILFGSHAKGTVTNQSDIDLAIQLVSRHSLTPVTKLNYLAELGQILDTDIDLVDLTTVGQPLLSQIIKYGKRLKGPDQQYIELAIKNINTTQDFMPYIERIMTTRRRRWLDS